MTHPATNHDDLPVSGDKTIADISNSDLARMGVALEIPGINHTNGREANAAAYAAFLNAARDAAADAAIAQWLSQAGSWLESNSKQAAAEPMAAEPEPEPDDPVEDEPDDGDHSADKPRRRRKK